MSKYRGCFVVYDWCQLHLTGAALDDGDNDPDTGAMIMDAMRENRLVEYRTIYDDVRIGGCTCARTPETP